MQRFLAHEPRLIALLFSLCALCAAPSLAQEAGSAPITPSATPTPTQSTVINGDAYDGKSHISLTPYIWIPGVDARFKFSNVPPPAGSFLPADVVNVSVGPSKLLAKLNSALMVAAEFRKSDNAILTDFIYLNLSSNAGAVTSISGRGGIINIPITVDTSSRLSGTIWGAAYSHTFSHSSTDSFDGLVGFRYNFLKADASWDLTGPLGLFSPHGSASKSESTLAAIVGVRGKVGIGEHWFVPYYLDYGGGGNLETWQGLAGVAYAYHSGVILLVWRNLEYNSNNSGSVFQHIRIGGPTIGWTFRLH